MTEKLFTVDPLVVECEREKTVVSSPRLEARLKVAPEVLATLLEARTGSDLDPDDPRVAHLKRAGFLHGDSEEAPPTPRPWDTWGVAAWNYHQRIRDTRFIEHTSQEERSERYLEEVLSRPRPAPPRAEAADVLLLPRTRGRASEDFWEVLERRRTCRRFEDAPVDLQQLADILHYSFAPLRFVDAGPMGVLQLRAAASGGARHETDAYVAVFNVTGVSPGLYRYDEIRHGLAPVRDGLSREDMEHLTFHQGFYNRAAFGVFTVAMTERFVWKYRHPVAYKLLHHNVGHVAQVFSTVCAALRLGAAITGAIRNSEADALLGLAGPAEFVTFALACGHPVLGPDGLPGDVQAPAEPWRA